MDYNFLNNVNELIKKDWEMYEFLNSNHKIAKMSRKIDKMLEKVCNKNK